MKRSFLNKYLSVFLAGATLFSLSCKKVYDLEPQNAVDRSQMYRDVYDADAAIIGVYGKLMNVAKQYVILNELRGDLMDITFNSDQYLRQLSEQNVTSDNPYINPQPFYDVIVNCNDVMKNFKIMLSQNKLKTEEFRQRYSDVAAIRTWLYLQLGIHYGKVPYVTQPLENVSDLHDQAKFPMVDFDPLIDSLVAFTESLPSLDDYPSGSTLITVVDGYQTQKFFINKNHLLGDLYLWDGQYRKAAVQFRKVMETGSSLAVGESYYNMYRVSSFSESGVSYSRSNDASSLVYTPGWRYLFERGQDNQFNFEWTWVLPFDAKFAPQNPFIDLFSPSGGRYLVKPSQQAMDNWSSQVQTVLTSPIAGMPFDARANFTYKFIGGQPVIMKYLYNYFGLGSTPISILNKQGNWFINRATTAHLHFAEAANRDGQYKIAYALVNRGIRDAYDSLQPTPMTTDSIGKNFRSYVQNRNVTSQENTLALPPPYDFDARQGDAPAYRSTWYRNNGVRGRANLFARKLPTTDSLTNIENMIIDENALELAYEGQRWPDLLRIAMRRNDPAFLADKVYNKLLKSGMSAGAASAARSKLLNRNWFLPFKWQ
jgi:hypothetical protein